MGRGEKSLLYDPGSELRLGRENEKEKGKNTSVGVAKEKENKKSELCLCRACVPMYTRYMIIVVDVVVVALTLISS